MTVPGGVVDFLTLGFVPDTARAAAYLESVLRPAEAVHDPAPFPEVLSQVIHDEAAARGEREIAIPLTGGLDSRGILGAALAVFPADRIHCFTFGSPESHDCAMAMRVCRHLGIRHVRADSYTVDWDLDRAIEVAGTRWRERGALQSIDGLLLFDHLARHIPRELLVLSGYLGGLTGSRLPRVAAERTEPARVVDAFLRRNRILRDGRERPDLQEQMGSFLARRPLPSPLPGCTPADQLDLAFRQGLRIRPGVTGAFSRVLAPYEDPRLVRTWLSCPVEERVGKALYRRILRARYGDTVLLLPRGGLRVRAGRALRRLLSTQWRSPAARRDLLEVRGDPRRYEGMAATLRELSAAFERRGILPEGSLAEATRAFPADMTRYHAVRWAATAEMYMRVGALAA